MEIKDLSAWRKSSYSTGGANNCVEVGNGTGVLVRDTTDRDGGTLSFSADAWQAFMSALRN